ncbi:MAG: hypothetical protein RSF77_00140 [Oscillospiraceae bacterium]
MGTELLSSLGISLVLTLFLEMSFCYLVGLRSGRDFILLILVNILTNPTVVLLHHLFSRFSGIEPWIFISALELAAIGIEGLCYRLASNSIKHPFLLSLGANGFSYFIGLFITKIF